VIIDQVYLVINSDYISLKSHVLITKSELNVLPQNNEKSNIFSVSSILPQYILNIVFSNANVTISYVYVILFSPPLTCYVRAIVLFCRHILFARTVDLRPVVTDICVYLHIYVHLFFLFFLRVIWEIKRRRTNESVCVCVRTVDSSVCPTVVFTHSFFLYRNKHTKKKEEEKYWPMLYMCAYFIWTYWHFPFF
jgi:hypothetical protein